MPFGSDLFSKPDSLVEGLRVSDATFSARLAFGVRNSPRNGQTNWIVLDVSGGSTTAGEDLVLPSTDPPEESLEVVVGIAATEEVWRQVDSDSAFLHAVDGQKFYVTGEAPFFVRYISIVLEIWAHLRSL